MKKYLLKKTTAEMENSCVQENGLCWNSVDKLTADIESIQVCGMVSAVRSLRFGTITICHSLCSMGTYG